MIDTAQYDMIAMQDGKDALQLGKSRQVREVIQDVIDARADAVKQAAVLERGRHLMDMILDGNAEGVRTLIDSNEFEEVYNISTSLEQCPYHRAIEVAVHLKQLDIVTMLLNAGADPDVTHMSDRSTCVIRLCAEPRMPSFPTTELSRQKERARYGILEALITIGKAGVNAARKVTYADTLYHKRHIRLFIYKYVCLYRTSIHVH